LVLTVIHPKNFIHADHSAIPTFPVVMAGNGSMQEQDVGNGSISVSLSPVWLNLSQTSQVNGKTVSNYVIRAAFTGTIDGVNVVGNLNQLAIPSRSDTSNSARDKNSANGFSPNSLEGLAGILASIGMLYYMAKDHKQTEVQKKNDAAEGPNPQAKIREVETQYQTVEVAHMRLRFARVESMVSNVRQAYKVVGQANDIQSTQDTIREHAGRLMEILATSKAIDAIEQVPDDLFETINELKEALNPITSVGGRGEALHNVHTALNKICTSLQNALQDQSNDLETGAEETIRDAQEAIDTVQEQSEAQEQSQKEQEEQDNRDVTEPVDDSQYGEPKEQDSPRFEDGQF
jgi:hypothetical protein